ncbi:peptidase [Sphaerisporangium siamense]|uniref:Succinyl-diaminopimelate desuccinylase n=1 Tax=Sphaerisporangium siamense TaxID=795645 RepID=A0A7W7GA58_9ACTN|nr:M20/M25/M40 family metallo-hydrolase [Sphaerisporangium siamense]MBB4699611.1 succinyl-diaminopimelate desuccinylase [Sphaerisporangium siamense]GII87025.1 peptidase [Sphaerisporangium siamense]
MSLSEELDALVDGAREDLVALCGRLVAAPSVNPPGDTRAVADVVAGYLREHGCEPDLLRVDPVMPNVVSRIEGTGPGPHLVLNVHMDTMDPGDESLWSVPVHEMTREDGRLYGLGMGNMKGAVAAMSLAYTLLARHADRWPGTITFTAVSDECVFGDNGAAHLLGALPELRGDGLICGEGPGWMRLAVAEKGVLWLELSATADGGHSSLAESGSGAVPRLARFVAAVDELNGWRTTLPAELADVRASGEDPSARLSANPGTVEGGSYVSQISTRAAAAVDFRLPPGIRMSDVEDQVSRIAARIPGADWSRIKGWDANWTGTRSPLVSALAGAFREVRGAEPEYTIRLPASDASRWRALGVPALCFGPQPVLAAGIDDYAEEQDVVDCAKIYARAALDFLTA